jgi:hypothetical protein
MLRRISGSIGRVRSDRCTALVALGCVAALVGCGSSSTKHASKPAGGQGPGQASTSSSPAATGNGVAAKPPKQIVADAAAHGDVESQPPIRANAAYWTAHLGARGAALAERWIQVPPAHAQAFTSSLGRFAPATLSRCLSENHGTLTVAGMATVEGRPAVIVKDAGNAPGSSPGTIAVATTGAPYPLQASGTGRQRAGGHIDVCNDGKPSDSRGILTFSQFGAVKPIPPPANAIRLGSTSVI